MQNADRLQDHEAHVGDFVWKCRMEFESEVGTSPTRPLHKPKDVAAKTSAS